MSQLNRIVKVNITVSSARVSRASFGVALLLAKTQAFGPATKSYTALEDMLMDGFLDTDSTYLAAADYFSQENGAAELIVGRRAMTSLITVTLANTFAYTIPIGGVDYIFTSDADATMAEIRTGLLAVINAATATHGFVATTTSTNQISLTPQAGKTGLKVGTLSANLVMTSQTAEATIAADLTRIQTASAAWYAIVLVDRDDDDAEEVATWVASASAPHVFVYTSADADIVNDAEATDIAAVFQDEAFRRSWVFYHSLAATRYPDAALFGKILAMQPGSYAVAHKTLDNMPVDELTDPQCAIALAKNAMIYIPIAGRNCLEEGKVAEGEFIDVIIFIDWLTARQTEDVFLAIATPPKVAYTDAGISVIESAVRASVQQGIDVGGLADDPAPTYTIPKATSVSPGDRAARVLRNVKWKARLAGAIQTTEIDGDVSV